MARSRTRRGAGLFDRIKQAAAQNPLGQAGLQAMKDARSFQNSAVASQARQLYGIPPPPANTYPNPYGRSASSPPTPVPVAKPVEVPVATPVAAPVATPVAPTQLSVMGRDVVSDILFQLDSGRPFTPDDYVPKSVAKEGKKQVKNRDRNLALLEAVGTLSKEVKALLDTKPVQTTPFETLKINLSSGKYFSDFQKYEALTKPEFRAEVAQGLVSAQDPPGKPNERRFLPGVINQLATAIRGAMQKELLLGGRTRRNRKLRRSTRRGGAGFVDRLLNRPPPPSTFDKLMSFAKSDEGKQAFGMAKDFVRSDEARYLRDQAKAAYASPEGQAIKQQAMQALRDPKTRQALLQGVI